jgi:hypothetical protein
VSQIVNLVPYNVDLLQINHGSNSINVIGIAPSEAEIFEYARELRGSGRFSLVVISSINEDIIILNEGEEEEEEKIIRYQFGFLIL